MGNEIKRDACPEKYYGKGSALKNCIPVAIAWLLVALSTGALLNQGGLEAAVVIIIEVVLFCAVMVLFYFLFKGQAKRLAESYISVCENGVCGVCPQNGFKNKNFELAYNEITKMAVKGQRLALYAPKGNVYLTLTDAAGTAALIKSKNPAL